VASVVVTFLWARGRVGRPADPVQPAALVRYSLFPAEGTTFHSGYDSSFALSPDGRHIVYVGAKTDGTKQLSITP
jgi:WD40-like Beta Propeller Repeat